MRSELQPVESAHGADLVLLVHDSQTDYGYGGPTGFARLLRDRWGGLLADAAVRRKAFFFFTNDAGACGTWRVPWPSVLVLSHYHRDGGCHNRTLLVPPTTKSLLRDGGLVGTAGPPPPSPAASAARTTLLFFVDANHAAPRSRGHMRKQCRSAERMPPLEALMEGRGTTWLRLRLWCEWASQPGVAIVASMPDVHDAADHRPSPLRSSFCLEAGGQSGYVRAANSPRHPSHWATPAECACAARRLRACAGSRRWRRAASRCSCSRRM